MKKTLCFCLAFLLCFMTFAYAAEESSFVDVFGKVEGNDYVNELIGFSFKLEDWHFCTDEEIDAMNTISKATLTEDYAKMVEEAGNVYIMMAIAPDMTNINISLKSLGANAALYKTVGMESIVRSNVDLTASSLKLSGFQNVSVEYVKTLVEDQEYDGMLVKYELQNVAMCSRVIMLICDNYLVSITITGREEDKVIEALQKLHHLK